MGKNLPSDEKTHENITAEFVFKHALHEEVEYQKQIRRIGEGEIRIGSYLDLG